MHPTNDIFDKETPLLEEEQSAHTRWWIQASPDRDCYDLYVVRYSVHNGQVVQSWYFQPPNIAWEGSMWTSYAENEVIYPAYRFPGEILNLFASAEWLDRSDIEQSLRSIAQQIFTEELTRPTPPVHRTDGTPCPCEPEVESYG